MLAQRVGKLVRTRASPALGARRLASRKAAAPAGEAGASSAGEPRVTREMVAREAKEMAKLMIGVRGSEQTTWRLRRRLTGGNCRAWR